MATETRLQQLRRQRSDRLRARLEPQIRLRQQLGWACGGCGCDRDDYSLYCQTCWDRANRRRVDHQDPDAIAYLVMRKTVRFEEAAALSAERQTGRPTNRVTGSAGNDLIRQAYNRQWAART